MDVREKVAGLLNEAGDNVFIVANQPVELQKKRIYYEIADYLIAQGVTVQEWISVEDRLPESGKDAVLIALRWGTVDIGWCEEGRWGSEFVNEYDDGEVTHWMPMPQPPKGD